MNWDTLKGEWNEAKAHIKAKWAKLTDDDLANLEAKKDALVGKVQQRYGIMKDDAERQVDAWIEKFDPKRKPDQDRPAKKAS
jgi:uncharacterized protein YjbJ (UPF0337 family)